MAIVAVNPVGVVHVKQVEQPLDQLGLAVKERHHLADVVIIQNIGLDRLVLLGLVLLYLVFVHNRVFKIGCKGTNIFLLLTQKSVKM